MIISVTRLRLRSIRYLPAFVAYSALTLRQMAKASGFRDGRLLADRRLTFWTATRWTGEDAMRQWRGGGAHGRAMAKLPHWCDEASVLRWEGDDAAFPGWDECYRRMVADGRSSPVWHPSPGQLVGLVPPPRQSWSAVVLPLRRLPGRRSRLTS